MIKNPVIMLCAFLLLHGLCLAQSEAQQPTRPLNFERLFAQSERPVKCGVPAMFNILNLNKNRQNELLAQFARPVLPESYVTPSGRFRLHYNLTGTHAVPAEITNDAGVPDWVYIAGEAAEYAHSLLVDTLGFKEPSPDNNIDGPEFDIYFQNLRSYYGLTIPVQSGVEAHSYLEIENDFNEGFFTWGLDAVRVTIAHEYFHALQFEYAIRIDTGNEDEIFFYEMSSTWFEDRAYDEINDYYGYLDYLFNHPELPPFEYPDNNNQADVRIYGISIFLKYWFNSHNDAGLQRMWTNFMSNRGLRAMEKEINARGMSFATALAEFYGWCLYTGFRAEPEKYFTEGANYPMIKVIDTLQIDQRSTATVNINALSARYIKLDFASGQYFTAIIEDGPNDGRLAAVGEKGDGNLWDLSTGTFFKLGTGFNEGGAFIALVNGTIPASQGAPYETSSFRVNLNLTAAEDDVTKFSLAPNPFKIGGATEQLTINYEAPGSNPFEIKIFAESGELVWQKMTNNLYRETWSGRNLDGSLAPAGIYFVVVPDFEKKKNVVLKLAVLR